MRRSSAILVFLAFALIADSFSAPTEEPIIVRSKRQQCRCVKNPNGGLTCSCAKGPAGAAQSSSPQHDIPMSTDIANQLSAQYQPTAYSGGPARCGCIQIVFQGAPQYNCQCGDPSHNPLPSTPRTTRPTTTPSTTTTTTTTTPRPSTTQSMQTRVPTYTQGNGACNCIMISITSPQTAQYQCDCGDGQNHQQYQQITYLSDEPETLSAPLADTTTPMPSSTTTATTTSSSTTTTPAPAPVYSEPEHVEYYPAAAQLHAPQPACYCVDPSTNSLSPQCGCSCDCASLVVTIPNAVCGCPQAPTAQAQAYPVETYDYTQVFQNQPSSTVPSTTTTTPMPTTTTPHPTMAPTEPQMAPLADTTQYPLTTTCVMYVNVPTNVCSCLPQYDQCAANVCCLKAKYRSYKKAEEKSDSTIDMLMNVLKSIKTKLE